MSKVRDQFLDLTANEKNVERRAKRLRTWLRERGWAEPYPDLRDWLAPKGPDGLPPLADAVGPRLRACEPRLDWANGGSLIPITIISTEEYYHAGEATDNPRCPRCDIEKTIWHFDEAGYDDESEYECESCGAMTIVSDWWQEIYEAQSHLAIVVDTMGCHEELLEELRREATGRWEHIYLAL